MFYNNNPADGPADPAKRQSLATLLGGGVAVGAALIGILASTASAASKDSRAIDDLARLSYRIETSNGIIEKSFTEVNPEYNTSLWGDPFKGAPGGLVVKHLGNFYAAKVKKFFGDDFDENETLSKEGLYAVIVYALRERVAPEGADVKSITLLYDGQIVDYGLELDSSQLRGLNKVLNGYINDHKDFPLAKSLVFMAKVNVLGGGSGGTSGSSGGATSGQGSD